MALDPLPSDITVKDRTAWRESYLRSYRLRNPTASTLEGTQPYIDASALADQLAILSENARQIARSIPLSEMVGSRLDQKADEVGIPPRFPDVGAVGYVTIDASAGGVTIFSGDELTEPNKKLRFQCIATRLYSAGDSVPIAAISTGPTTNLDADTVLVWSSPRPGCVPQATIDEQTDGTGLSGGRIAETDDELRQRISDQLANPAAAGNDAAYQRAISNSVAHGVAVQQPFTWPCILGPGTIGCGFTMRVTAPGATRCPSAAQTAQVRDYVMGLAPVDDQYLEIQLVSQPLNIVLSVEWAKGSGWTDIAPWPVRYATGGGAIVVQSATSPSAFVLRRDNNVYSGVTPPAAGNVIAFYNKSTASFARKRILSVTGSGPWTIAVDNSNAASDTAYTPTVGQRAMPWSDSLDSLVSTIRDYFDGLGPGEMRATFFDPGLRERRNPQSPKSWPSTVSNRLAGNLLDVTTVQDCVVREGLGTTTTVGTAGSLAYLIELADISAFTA